jgi:hypothetical protein
MWRFRNHLQEASRLATANYPETLGTIAVVNAPSFFPTIWGWIKVRMQRSISLGNLLTNFKGWFDEGTRNKIIILGKDPGAKLLGLIDVEHLPKRYGGALEWNYEDELSLDSDAEKLLGEMPRGPIIFENGKAEQPSAAKQAT